MTGVIIEEFKAVQRNTLRGLRVARFPSGMIIAEISVHRDGEGHHWASPPSKPMIDRDGRVMRDRDGKTRWQPLITFSNKNARDQWSAAVVQAVHDHAPQALAERVPEHAG